MANEVSYMDAEGNSLYGGKKLEDQPPASPYQEPSEEKQFRAMVRTMLVRYLRNGTDCKLAQAIIRDTATAPDQIAADLARRFDESIEEDFVGDATSPTKLGELLGLLAYYSIRMIDWQDVVARVRDRGVDNQDPDVIPFKLK